MIPPSPWIGSRMTAAVCSVTASSRASASPNATWVKPGTSGSRVAVDLPPRRRERPEGLAVEGADRADEAGAAGVGARRFQRSLDGLSPAVAEEAELQVARGQLSEALGQLRGHRVQQQMAAQRHAAELPATASTTGVRAMAHAEHAGPARGSRGSARPIAVDVAACPHLNALKAHELDELSHPRVEVALVTPAKVFAARSPSPCNALTRISCPPK